MPYVHIMVIDQMIVEGFISFMNADAEGHTQQQGVVITPETEQEIKIQSRTKNLFN